MPTNTPNKILLISGSNGVVEGTAGAAVKPGHFVEREADGDYVVHATTQVKDGCLLIALEDSEQGNTITDAFAAGDVMKLHPCRAGDVVYARLAASATAVTIGLPLTLAADGTVKAGTVGTHDIVATAEEAVDNSAGASEAFVRIMIA